MLKDKIRSGNIFFIFSFPFFRDFSPYFVLKLLIWIMRDFWDLVKYATQVTRIHANDTNNKNKIVYKFLSPQVCKEEKTKKAEKLKSEE